MNSNPCIVLVAPPDSYRVAPYISAAKSLGVSIIIASRGEHSLVNEISDGLHIDLDSPDSAIKTIVENAEQYNITGIVAADDRATEIAAQAAKLLNLPHNPPQAVHLTRWKHKARQALSKASLPVPDFWITSFENISKDNISGITFPCVIKPLNLSASRGVIRCNTIEDLKKAATRIKAIVEKYSEPESIEKVLIEEFIPGKEIAVEAILRKGKLIPITIFDKPDPLDGPYFEETFYISPAEIDKGTRNKVYSIIEQACLAYGLETGPIHAELRINDDGIYIIEIAARTIGGECAKLLEYASGKSLEALVIEYALGINSDVVDLQSAAGVLMIPTPRSGILRRVEGVLKAQAVKNIESVTIAIREGHELVTLPEGASYLGFIFATGESANEVETALREAQSQLTIVVDPLWKISEGSPGVNNRQGY